MQANDADRTAAAHLMHSQFTGVPGLERDAAWAETVRRGEDDNYPIVQFFAAHRIQSARNARAEALGEAIKAVRKFQPVGPYANHRFQVLNDEIVAAIETLKGPQ